MLLTIRKDKDLIQERFDSLSPRETEICNMIRNGMSSKQISESLHLSTVTIHKHREQIRNKLGLTNMKINLSTYLRSRQS